MAGLDRIADVVVRATAGLGRPPEGRPFRGHVTLARVAKGANVDLRRHTGWPVAAGWPVTELCLVESRLSPAGARYAVLHRVALTNR